MKYLIFKKFKSNKGFTLAELLVALFCFGLLMSTIGAIAITISQGQRRAYISQAVQDETRYIMEMMSKEIRMAKIDDASDPLRLQITNSRGDKVVYQLCSIEGNLRRRDTTSIACSDISGDKYNLNSSKIKLLGNFYVMDNAGLRPPRITISIQAESSDPKYADSSRIYLQMTISSRDYKGKL